MINGIRSFVFLLQSKHTKLTGGGNLLRLEDTSFFQRIRSREFQF